MTMAFKYFSYNGIKENFWGNFPYSTLKVQDCDPQFLYTVPGNMSSAMNLYGRGLDDQNGGTYGSGFAQTIPSVLQLGSESTRDYVATTSGYGQENFKFPNQQRTNLNTDDLREDFSCIKPGNHLKSGNMYGPLKAYDYSNKNVNTGAVPENPVTGPVVCRERIMYSTGRTKTSAARNWLVGDLAISSKGIVQQSAYQNNLLTAGATAQLTKGAHTTQQMISRDNGTVLRTHAEADGRC